LNSKLAIINEIMKREEKKFVPVMITPFNLKAEVDLDAVSILI